MSEEENVSLEIVEEAVPETPVEQTETLSEGLQEEKRPNDIEYNFKELRKQRDEDKRRYEAAEQRSERAEQRNMEFMELMKQRSQVNTPQEKDAIDVELEKISKDDLMTLDNVDKKLIKYDRGRSKKERDLEDKVTRLESMMEEQALKVKYPDIDEVVSSANIERLNKEDPDVALMLSQMKDPKQKIVMAYKYIKKTLPLEQLDMSNQKKIEENSKKPMSVQTLAKKSAIANQHLYEDGRMTDAMKRQMYKEMQEAKRGR